MRNLTQRPVSVDYSSSIGWWWPVIIPLLAALNVMFEGGVLAEIGLTMLSASVLAALVGWRQRSLYRDPLPHERPHVGITMLTGIVIWTTCVIGIGVVGVVAGVANAMFFGYVVLLLMLGQFVPVFIGFIWGSAIRALDWYPLRHTRASVIRLITLYIFALVMVMISSVLLCDYPRWLWFLVLVGECVIWLGVARLWHA